MILRFNDDSEFYIDMKKVEYIKILLYKEQENQKIFEVCFTTKHNETTIYVTEQQKESIIKEWRNYHERSSYCG